MEIKTLKIFFIIFAFNIDALAQPSLFDGTLLFNLTEKENSWDFMTPDEFENKNIHILSFNKESTLKYDNLNKSFSFTTTGLYAKCFAIVYQKDTIYVDYPSLDFGNSVYVKTPIPLNGKSFSFYNEGTYDAMHSNCRSKVNTVFYLCDVCFISKQYEMPDKTRKQIRKKYLSNIIKLKK